MLAAPERIWRAIRERDRSSRTPDARLGVAELAAAEAAIGQRMVSKLKSTRREHSTAGGTAKNGTRSTFTHQAVSEKLRCSLCAKDFQ
jgi:hypothetical protein